MQRTELISIARRRARDKGLRFHLIRQGREHEIWQVGDPRVSIPRHRELSPGVSRRVLRDIDQELSDR